MSQYTFTFKKDDIFVNFTTTDKIAVENQFKIWVDSASEYAKTHPTKAKKVEEVKPQAEKKAPVAEKSTTAEQKPAETIVQQPQPEQKPEVAEEKAEEEVEETKEEVFEQASSLLKTINNIQNPPEEEPKVEEKPDFDAVLEKTIENPTFEPNKVKDPVYLNLVNSKNTNDKFHYLMITAYYLSEFEKMERFSIKQINAKLMNNLSEVIDHTMLQEAINQNFIEFVPDLTGTSDVGEYRLTRLGEEFFANKI